MRGNHWKEGSCSPCSRRLAQHAGLVLRILAASAVVD